MANISGPILIGLCAAGWTLAGVKQHELNNLNSYIAELNRVHFGTVGFPSWPGILLFPYDDLHRSKAFSDQCYKLTISVGTRRLRIYAIWL